MNLGNIFYKIAYYLDEKRKIIITICLSILGFIVLGFVFFLSSDEFSISDEANILLKNIEQRRYSEAVENYDTWSKKFSESKMKRLNDSITAKLNQLLLENGDNYINKKLSKENYVGFINTINSLTDIQIDLKRIQEQAKRVSEIYANEGTDYETAISYINIVSSLNGMENDLEQYKYEINEVNESRKAYEIANHNKKTHKYYEAIESYNKVSEKDKKYYFLAEEEKQECIEQMYDYYIEKSKDANKNGDYEEALKYISYLKKYYPDDNALIELENLYKENLETYNLTLDDILNIIANKGNHLKESLSVEYFPQMIEDKKFYYIEVYKYDELIDEVLIDAKDKKVYSYKDSNKSFNSDYYDGYFRVLENGQIQFAITEDEAKFIVEEKIKEEDKDYKDINILQEDEMNKYINSDLDTLLEEESTLYYPVLVNNGWFKKKDLYFVNMYTKEVFVLNENDELVKI